MIRVRINGVRNRVAPFGAEVVGLSVGAMEAVPPLNERLVLLTAESPGGPDDDAVIDVELAIPVSQIEALIALLRDRAAAQR
jgi:hypothetical protein